MNYRKLLDMHPSQSSTKWSSFTMSYSQIDSKYTRVVHWPNLARKYKQGEKSQKQNARGFINISHAQAKSFGILQYCSWPLMMHLISVLVFSLSQSFR